MHFRKPKQRRMAGWSRYVVPLLAAATTASVTALGAGTIGTPAYAAQHGPSSAPAIRPDGAQGHDVKPNARLVREAATANISSSKIVANAWNWYIKGNDPPYSETSYWHSRTDFWGDGNGDNPTPAANPPSWREDCSGFVSHAWGFSDSDGGFTTYDVDQYSTDISWAQLQPGDALLLNGVTIGGTTYNHMGLFMGWNSDGTYNVMDETETGTGTQYQTGISRTDGFWQYAQPIQYNGYVSTPAAGGSWQVSQAASQASGTVDAFYTEDPSLNGGLGHAFYYPGGGWQDATDMGSGPMGSEPSAVTSSPGTVYAFWEGQAPYHLWYREYTPSAGWSSAEQLGAMGSLGGPPQVVAQSNGTVDVFWKGQDDALWHAYYTVNGGWVTKPQDLGGDLASNPAPVVSKSGTIDVFWKDAATGGLEHAYTDAGGTWSAPQSIPGMGTIGDPHATGQPNGTIDVFWAGASGGGLWHAWYTASGGWTTKPTSMGGTLTSEPDVVSSSEGTVDVFWLDGSTLYRAYTNPGSGWSAPVAMTQMGTIGGELFATSERNGTIDLFWKGTNGSLWHGWYNAGSGWQGPQNLGGDVG